ncbi:MAG: sigma-54-dependent Fis family transcriptional regulator [Nitrosomonadales bacterium]|nr:sigma-54-dependent Fis family transcriptional regulator [Nitrosomonadales bacterium]
MSKPARPFLCLVEDDEIMGESLCDRFALEGLRVDWYQSGTDALRAIANTDYCMVISDIRLPGLNGEELFEKLLAEKKTLPPFIFITGYGSIDRAVRLLKLGAADYISKPFDLDLLVEKICKLCPSPKLEAAAVKNSNSLGISPVMRGIEEGIPKLARLASTILITGESGVGKEHVALLIHRHSREEADTLPFVPVNCGAITETLLESELFGYEKGAFTGAARTRKGVIEQAHGGTLFLDEIGDMPLPMQVKLLRAIQERRIVRVGGETPVPVDVRLICATNRDLKKMVEEGTFREDLYYRIHVIRLRIPPLRERKEDILWFAQLFLRQCAEQHGGEARLISPLVERALLDYPWPGNLRELRHSVERACILSPQATLEPVAFFDETPGRQQTGEVAGEDSLSAYLRSCERKYILQALENNQWHFGHTSASLGISRKNLWEKMKKLDIQIDKGKGGIE